MKRSTTRDESRNYSIGPEKSHVGDIIRESGCGFRVDHGDVEKLKSVIRQATELSQSDLSAIRECAQSLVGRKYSKSLLSRRFIRDYLT